MIDEWKLTLPLLERPKVATLLFYCLTPDDFTHQRRAPGHGKGLINISP